MLWWVIFGLYLQIRTYITRPVSNNIKIYYKQFLQWIDRVFFSWSISSFGLDLCWFFFLERKYLLSGDDVMWFYAYVSVVFVWENDSFFPLMFSNQIEFSFKFIKRTHFDKKKTNVFFLQVFTAKFTNSKFLYSSNCFDKITL